MMKMQLRILMLKSMQRETEDEYYDALRKKYNGGLSSGELQTKHAIEQGYYEGDDAEEVYQNIKEQEADIASWKMG